MYILCHHCKNLWDYGGHAKIFCTCPNCYYKVNIKKQKPIKKDKDVIVVHGRFPRLDVPKMEPPVELKAKKHLTKHNNEIKQPFIIYPIEKSAPPMEKYVPNVGIYYMVQS